MDVYKISDLVDMYHKLVQSYQFAGRDRVRKSIDHLENLMCDGIDSMKINKDIPDSIMQVIKDFHEE